MRRHSFMGAAAMVVTVGLLIMVAAGMCDPDAARARLLVRGMLTTTAGLGLCGLVWYVFWRNGWE